MVMIHHSEHLSELRAWRQEALECIGLDSTVENRNVVSYLDVSGAGMRDLDDQKGVIPCRSVWAASGERLAAVLVYEIGL